MNVASLLLLISFLVEVHSQIFPYVSFMGQILANHSYVDLSLVGRDRSGRDSVQCHTDLSTCCTGAQGSHRGDWYFSNGTRLQFTADIHERRDNRSVDIRRENSATSPVGIYRCEIPTIAVHNNGTSVRARAYVGLYETSGGKLKFVVYWDTVIMKRKHAILLLSHWGFVLICGKLSQIKFLCLKIFVQ